MFELSFEMSQTELNVQKLKSLESNVQKKVESTDLQELQKQIEKCEKKDK